MKKIRAIMFVALLLGSIFLPVVSGDEPFNNTENLGWELLDGGAVFHMWNQYDSYYFNRSNGVQFSNHYEEYWAKNVLMLGYHAGDEWNLMYRTDQLSGFTQELDCGTDDYINVTLWKDLTYEGYSFRLAIRYCLGVNDSDLTIIPYIKNTGIDIPYTLAFGWEMKDIKIDNTYENDRIQINETSYFLNHTLDNKYTNITKTVYNETTNETYSVKNGEFRLENIDRITPAEYLYLRWNPNLDYLVWVKSRDEQHNAPVTLFIKIGALDVDQEKSTELHWLDAEGDYIDSWELTGVNRNPYGIATDGSNIWVVDCLDAIVYKYNMAGNYIDSWGLTGANTMPYGITTNGANIWVCDLDTDAVYKYGMAGNYIDSWELTAENGHPHGLATDGSNIWVVDNTDDVVYKYNMAGGSIDSWPLTGANDIPYGIATDGSNIWVVDIADDVVYKYNMAGGSVDSWPLTAANDAPTGITTDGSNIWVVDDGDDVYKYEKDESPPTPDPLTWSVEPVGISDTSIFMSATSASDDTPPIYYYFHETTGHSGGADSEWQGDEPYFLEYTNSELSENTQYGYEVKAKDSASTPNEGDYSTPISYEYTEINQPTSDEFDLGGTITSASIAMVISPLPPNYNVDSTGVYFDFVSGGTGGNDRAFSNDYTYTDSGLQENTQYTYRAKFRNGDGEDEGEYCGNEAVYTYANPPTAGQLVVADFGDTWILWRLVDVDNNPDGGITDGYFDIVTNPGGGSGGLSTYDDASYYYFNDTGLTVGQEYGMKARYDNYVGVDTTYCSEVKQATAGISPTVTTRTADIINDGGFRSGGTSLNDGGASITAKGVRYGTSTPPGTNSASSGTGTADYYTTLSGLDENDLYYYRAYAINSVGTGYGSILSTSTLIGPPELDELDVLAITVSSITLTIDPDPPRENEGDTAVWYHIVSGVGGTDSGWDDFDSGYQDTGLSENSPYIYQAKFRNRVGTETDYCANDATVYTYANPPSDGEFSVDSYGNTWIKWKVLDVDNNPEAGSTGAYFNCVTGGASDSGWITDSVDGYYYYNATDLVETTYGFRVKYQNAEGESTTYTNEKQETTNNPPTPDPLTWSSEPAEDSATSISMTATTASDETPPIWYQFNETTGHSGGTDSSWQSADTSYTDSGLSENTQYGYEVKAKDSASTPNEGDYSTPISYEYTDIDPPTSDDFDLGTELTSASIKMIIDPQPPNPTADSTGVYFDFVSGGTGAADRTFSNTYNYNDTGLQENTQYTYRAKFRNGDGDDDNDYCSNEAVYTHANAPTNDEFSIVDYGGNHIRMKVLDVDNNPEVGSTGAYFECVTGGASDSGWITDSVGGYYYYNAVELSEDTTYGFRVKYQNAEGVDTTYTSEKQETTRNIPKVTSPSCEPTSGYELLTTFTFNVTYSDADGDDPSDICVNISLGTWYTNNSMTYVSGDNETGAIYTNSTTVPSVGVYSYIFLAYDGYDWNETSTNIFLVGYNTSFELNFPPYLDVGQYILSSGTIKNSSGDPLDQIWVYTKILDSSDWSTVPLSDMDFYVRDGFYEYRFSTSSMIPGIYNIIVNYTYFGLEFSTNRTLWLSVPGGPGHTITSVYFTFYDGDTGVGIEPLSFKVYVSDSTPLGSGDRIYGNEYPNTYTGQTLYYRIDDYFDNQIYPTSGTNETVSVTEVNQFVDIPIIWTSFSVKNMNHSIVYFKMTNGSRTYSQYLYPYEPFYWNVLPAEYTINLTYMNPISGAVVDYCQENITITGDTYYWIQGYDLRDIVISIIAVNSTIDTLVFSLSIDVSLINSSVTNLTAFINSFWFAQNSSFENVNSILISLWDTENSTFNSINQTILAFWDAQNSSFGSVSNSIFDVWNSQNVSFGSVDSVLLQIWNSENTTFGILNNTIHQFWNNINTSFGDIDNLILQFWNSENTSFGDISNSLTSIWNTENSTFENLSITLASFWVSQNDSFDNVEQILISIWNTENSTFENVTNTLSDIWYAQNTSFGSVNTVMFQIWSTENSTFENVTNTLTQMWLNQNSSFASVENYVIQLWGNQNSTFENVTNQITQFWANQNTSFDSVINEISTLWVNFNSTFGDINTTLIVFWNAQNSSFENVSITLSNIWTAQNSSFGDIETAFVNIWAAQNSSFGDIETVIGLFWDSQNSSFGDINSSIIQVWDLENSHFENITNSITSMWVSVNSSFDSVDNSIVQMWLAQNTSFGEINNTIISVWNAENSHFENVSNVLSNIWNAQNTSFGDVDNALINIWAAQNSSFGDIESIISLFWDSYNSSFDSINSTIIQIWDIENSHFENLTTDITQMWLSQNTSFDTVTNTLAQIWIAINTTEYGNITNTMLLMWDAQNSTFGDVTNTLSNMWSVQNSSFGDIDTAFVNIWGSQNSSFENITTIISNFWSFTNTTIGDIDSSIFSFWSAHNSSIESITTDIMSVWISQNSSFENVTITLASMWDAENTSFNNVQQTILAFWNTENSTFENVTNLITSMWNVQNSSFGNVTDIVLAFWNAQNSSFDTLTTFINTHMSYINNSINVSFIGINTKISVLWNDINVSVLYTNTLVIFSYNSIIENVTSMNASLIAKLLGILDNVSYVGESVFNKTAAVFDHLLAINTSLANKIADKAIDIMDKVENRTDRVFNKTLDILGNITGMNTSVINSIISHTSDILDRIDDKTDTVIAKTLDILDNITLLNTSICDEIFARTLDVINQLDNQSDQIFNKTLDVLSNLTQIEINISGDIITKTLEIITHVTDESNENMLQILEILDRIGNITDVSVSGMINQILNNLINITANYTVNMTMVIDAIDQAISQIQDTESVIYKNLKSIRDWLNYQIMPDVTIISRNPPMTFSVYDKEGMAFGNDYYMICPPLITIATTRVTTYGNYINSTPMVPGNGSVLNGTITILRDVLYLSGSGSISWVNITYANGTVMGNTSYIPSRIDIYGQNLTINASGNLSVLRVTKYNQVRKFDWTYYPGEGYGHEENRAGFHTAGIEVINPMLVPLYEVYVIAGFSDESNPDASSVEVRDSTNDGIILERGPGYDVTDTSVHFNLLSMTANETRCFTIGYYKLSAESYIYDEGIVSIPMYDITTYDGKSYNFFAAHWNNLYDRTFRGALYIKIDFLVPTDIDVETMRIWDVTFDRELDSSLFIPSRNFIRISAEAIGDVLPGGARKFDVYFLMTEYPGADPKEFTLNTQLWMGITMFLIIFLLGVGFIIIGAFFAAYDKKNKDRWKFCVSVGIFLVVVIMVLQAMGL